MHTHRINVSLIFRSQNCRYLFSSYGVRYFRTKLYFEHSIDTFIVSWEFDGLNFRNHNSSYFLWLISVRQNIFVLTTKSIHILPIPCVCSADTHDDDDDDDDKFIEWAISLQKIVNKLLVIRMFVYLFDYLFGSKFVLLFVRSFVSYGMVGMCFFFSRRGTWIINIGCRSTKSMTLAVCYCSLMYSKQSKRNCSLLVSISVPIHPKLNRWNLFTPNSFQLNENCVNPRNLFESNFGSWFYCCCCCSILLDIENGLWSRCEVKLKW